MSHPQEPTTAQPRPILTREDLARENILFAMALAASWYTPAPELAQ